MILLQFRVAAVAAALVVSGFAHAQNSQPSPIIKNPNPASSSSTDEDGTNPFARPGDNSPTGQGPSLDTNPPVNSTVGSGARNQREDVPAPRPNPSGK